jgi:hypothetical protein
MGRVFGVCPMAGRRRRRNQAALSGLFARSPHKGVPRYSTYANPPSFPARPQGSETVGIQALHPEASVEGLDERVVGRLACATEVERDAVLVCPEIEIARDELGAQINPDLLRVASSLAHVLQGPDDILTAITEPRIEYRHVARVCIDDRQYTNLPSGRELVVDEVHHPSLVRSCRHLPIFSQLRLSATLWCFVVYLQA